MKNLKFVFASNKESSGSTNMRVHQLSSIVKPHLPDDFSVSLSKINLPHKLFRRDFVLRRATLAWAKKQERDSILFISKACIPLISPEVDKLLKAKNIKILFDYVDSDINASPPVTPDVHICSSFRQADILKGKYDASGTPALIEVLLHNYDYSLINHPPAKQSEFNCAYIGNPAFLHLPESLSMDVELLPVTGIKGMRSILPRLGEFNCHYCIRPPHPEEKLIVKPFTKGFIASALEAVVIVNRGTDDAERLLGSDYPFLVGDLIEGEIQETFLRANASFGGPEWIEALDRMRSLHALVSPVALASQLKRIVNRIH